MVIGAKTFRLIIVNRLHTRQQTLWAGRKNAATFFFGGRRDNERAVYPRPDDRFGVIPISSNSR